MLAAVADSGVIDCRDKEDGEAKLPVTAPILAPVCKVRMPPFACGLAPLMPKVGDPPLAGAGSPFATGDGPRFLAESSAIGRKIPPFLGFGRNLHPLNGDRRRGGADRMVSYLARVKVAAKRQDVGRAYTPTQRPITTRPSSRLGLSDRPRSSASSVAPSSYFRYSTSSKRS